MDWKNNLYNLEKLSRCKRTLSSNAFVIRHIKLITCNRTQFKIEKSKSLMKLTIITKIKDLTIIYCTSHSFRPSGWKVLSCQKISLRRTDGRFVLRSIRVSSQSSMLLWSSWAKCAWKAELTCPKCVFGNKLYSC